MSAVRKLAEPKVDPGLAHWMRRAKIPCDEIAAAFAAHPRTVTEAITESRGRLKAARKQETAAKLSASKLSWCPEYLRDDYRALRRKIGTVDARAVIELRILRGGA